MSLTRHPLFWASQNKGKPDVDAVIHKAIKRHAGLSEFEDEAIAHEVKAIRKALAKAGFSIIWEG